MHEVHGLKRLELKLSHKLLVSLMTRHVLSINTQHPSSRTQLSDDEF